MFFISFEVIDFLDDWDKKVLLIKVWISFNDDDLLLVGFLMVIGVGYEFRKNDI